jgi:molybdopterin/thiamine biosynthesis adenylyltransferase
MVSSGERTRTRPNGWREFRSALDCSRQRACLSWMVTFMTNDRFDRQVRFFGWEGQRRLGLARVAVVGVGGIGSHVIQQLALLGIGTLIPVDAQELDLSNRNRLVGARENDPIPGTPKVDITERTIKEIDRGIAVEKVQESLVSESAFAAVVTADYVFGCLDSEGGRLVLTELTAAYSKPYIDVSSDIQPGDPVEYGGQVCIAWDGHGCLVCLDVIDRKEAEAELAGPDERRRRDELYGVRRDLLDEAGPSVASINGVVASLAVTEFMLGVTGVRNPVRLLSYYGRTGKVVVSTDEPTVNCYYCKGLRGLCDRADVQRYIREGIGAFLR